MFSLVSGMGGPNQVTNAISSGLVFALFQAGAAKVIFPYLVIQISGQIFVIGFVISPFHGFLCYSCAFVDLCQLHYYEDQA